MVGEELRYVVLRQIIGTATVAKLSHLIHKPQMLPARHKEIP